MNLPFSPGLSGFVLGPAGHRRVRASQALLALVVCLVFAVVQQAEVELGLIEPLVSNLLTLFNLSGSCVFFLLVRSGWSEPLRDPAMTVPQMVWGVLATVGSYAITGPARGAVMSILVLILVFGMFALRPVHARGLALFAFAMLSAVMFWKSRSDPVRYPPVIEAIHFVFGVIVLLGVSALSLRMGAMRAHLKAQKAELEQALEQIRLLATQDELTGLFNRRHMSTLLTQEQLRARRSGEPLCIVLMDLDHFKRINDGHGHHAGDAVLKGFAHAGRQALRGTDVLVNWTKEDSVQEGAYFLFVKEEAPWKDETTGEVLEPGEFVWTGGDTHLYVNHLEQVDRQLSREPRPLPVMKINPAVRDIFGFRYEDFELLHYDPWPAIKAPVAV